MNATASARGHDDEEGKVDLQFRLLAEMLPQMVWAARGDGAWDYVNEQWRTYTALTAEQLTRAGFAAAVHPDDAARSAAAWRAAVERGAPFAEELRLRRHDGAYRWFLARGELVRDGAGRVVRWLGTSTDVDERRRAEAGAPGQVQWVLDTWSRALATGAPYEVEHRTAFPAAREPRWYLVRAVPIRGASGEIVRWYGTCTDIHDAKLAEAALKEADQRKDDFLAMLAHELRNPLGPIRNAVELLRHTAVQQPALVRACGVIDRQVSHMARLVDDLLDVSRVARGRIQLRKERCDLARLLRHTAEDYRSTLEASGLRLDLKLPAGPVWVLGDPTRLSQAVSNLLHNADKFTDPGGRVTVALSVTPESSAVVRVRDTGIGVDPATLARMFEPFSQADRSLDRSRGGLGLGLALVKGLIGLHGGTVSAESGGIGHGTEMVLCLQIERSPDPPSERSAPPSIGSSHALRILIIEDNVDAAESLQALLALYGYHVEVGPVRACRRDRGALVPPGGHPVRHRSPWRDRWIWRGQGLEGKRKPLIALADDRADRLWSGGGSAPGPGGWLRHALHQADRPVVSPADPRVAHELPRVIPARRAASTLDLIPSTGSTSQAIIPLSSGDERSDLLPGGAVFEDRLEELLEGGAIVGRVEAIFPAEPHGVSELPEGDLGQRDEGARVEPRRERGDLLTRRGYPHEDLDVGRLSHRMLDGLESKRDGRPRDRRHLCRCGGEHIVHLLSCLRRALVSVEPLLQCFSKAGHGSLSQSVVGGASHRRWPTIGRWSNGARRRAPARSKTALSS
ncbi:PAS domain-containing hybrid sensor histidine kinase/response regulator [Sorangium sp. So ce861]|uniref:PAS domain-containing sensor histidine kinase n=1 Tax=Sorangium sp. So ce861 TaxID=3133323 RepID=UPI003F6465A7